MPLLMFLRPIVQADLTVGSTSGWGNCTNCVGELQKRALLVINNIVTPEMTFNFTALFLALTACVAVTISISLSV